MTARNIVSHLPNLCVILESIDLNCAGGCRIIRGAEFLEDNTVYKKASKSFLYMILFLHGLTSHQLRTQHRVVAALVRQYHLAKVIDEYVSSPPISPLPLPPHYIQY